MSRIMAGGAVTLLLTTGAFLFWQGNAATRPALPEAPAAKVSDMAGAKFAMVNPALPNVPEATAKTREEKRFGRADKDKDGKVTADELLAPRHKAFGKLDLDRNGMLSFNEWAAKTINKFEGADDDKNGALNAAEYAETAPKPKRHAVRCT